MICFFLSHKPKLIELTRYFRFWNDLPSLKNQPFFQTLIRITNLKEPFVQKNVRICCCQVQKKISPSEQEMYLTRKILIKVKMVVKTHGNSPSEQEMYLTRKNLI